MICPDKGQLIRHLVHVPLVHSADFRDKGEERTAATAAVLSCCSMLTQTHSLISLTQAKGSSSSLHWSTGKGIAHKLIKQQEKDRRRRWQVLQIKVISIS
jgi:hypothetical protein